MSALSTLDTAQPFEGNGYVWAQIGWLNDDDGVTYGLQLPADIAARVITKLTPLYHCLGTMTHEGEG